MTCWDESLQPEGSRVVVERLPDGIRVTLAPSKQLAVWLGGAFALTWFRFFFFLLLLFGLLVVERPAGFLTFVVAVAGVVFGCLTLIAVRQKARQTITISVHTDCVVIQTIALWRTRTRQWHRSDIVAIDAWHGLLVATTHGCEVIHETENRQELPWIANFLSEGMQLPEEIPPGPDEIPVTHYCPFWVEHRRAFLRTQRGALTLRHPLVGVTHFEFGMPSETPSLWTSAKAARRIPLTPSDTSCRITAEGSGCLIIAPPDVRCTLHNETTAALRIAPLGLPIYHREIPLLFLPSDKKRIRRSEADFVLTIWCKDGKALAEALARFWGAKD